MRRRFSQLIRKFPIIIRLPFYIYRLIQTRYTIGVVGVIFDDDQNVLLVEHVFHPDHPWGLPGGWIGRNEDPSLTIQRELAEELELNAEVQHILLAERRFRNHIDIAFRCIVHNEVGNISSELLAYKWVNIHHLPSLNTFQKKAIDVAIQQMSHSRN